MARTTLPSYRKDDAPKLTAIPADYDPSKFKKLEKADFADETSFLKFELWHLERRQSAIVTAIAAKKAEIKAAERFDKDEDRKAYASIAKMRAKIKAEKAKLAAAGYDPDELFDDEEEDLSTDDE